MNKEKIYKILFVEDEPGFQEIFKNALERNRRYRIVQAFDGEEGLKRAREEKPDLILLDLILPKKSGFELLKDFKEDKDLAVIPVIVLTNLESGEDIEKATSLGAKAYLIKADYGLDEITSRIEKIIKDCIPDDENK